MHPLHWKYSNIAIKYSDMYTVLFIFLSVTNIFEANKLPRSSKTPSSTLSKNNYAERQFVEHQTFQRG